MKAEDIRIGQRVKVAHAPEYVSTSDGKHKVLYKNEFITPVSSLVGQCGNVIKIEMDISKPIRLLIKFEDGRIDYLPSEALSSATPTNAPSFTYEDVAIGDVLITNVEIPYMVLGCGQYQVSCYELVYPNTPCLINYSDIKKILKPWSIKPHIGCLARVVEGAIDNRRNFIPYNVGIISGISHDFENSHEVMIIWPDKRTSFVDINYLEPL